MNSCRTSRPRWPRARSLVVDITIRFDGDLGISTITVICDEVLVVLRSILRREGEDDGSGRSSNHVSSDDHISVRSHEELRVVVIPAGLSPASLEEWRKSTRS